MARQPRHYVPGMPYHVVQRGNNRVPCFRDAADRSMYLKLWHDISKRYNTTVHAYCLMTNHVHFLCTCGDVDSISRTIQVLGSSYVRFFNNKYERTGTLWEGRHKAFLIQSSHYLLRCYRYIELNPVRAGMVANPAEYEWSSYKHNAMGMYSWLQPHGEYLALGNTVERRRAAYLRLFEQPLSESDIEVLRGGVGVGVGKADSDPSPLTLTPTVLL